MPLPEKTARNARVVRLLAKGWSTRAIGRREGISHVRVQQILKLHLERQHLSGVSEGDDTHAGL